MAEKKPKYLTLMQVAIKEKVNPATLRSWIRKGKVTPAPTLEAGTYLFEKGYKVEYPTVGRPKSELAKLREQRRHITGDLYSNLKSLVVWMEGFEASLPEQIKPAFTTAKDTVAYY